MLEAQRARNARRPIGPAESTALRHLRVIGGGEDGNYISPEDLPKYGQYVPEFSAALEANVVKGGWFKEKPSAVANRWAAIGFVPLIAGIAAIFIGVNVPISGLVLIGVAGIAGGLVILAISRAMPAVTMPGAMVRAMLAAYRRTLQKTMAQARSMQQVVDESGLTWLDTPDQAVVWGTALGLQDQIEAVLSRSLEDAKAAAAAGSSSGYVPYFPSWYRGSDGSPATTSSIAGSGASLFSASAVPDFGGMMSALGTIGNSPSSSGSGGGFSGGSSGGGGGGAGGGF
jgi:uncharacterized membrane protein YgcG